MDHFEAISDAIHTLRKWKKRIDLSNIFKLVSRKNSKLTEPALEEAMNELVKKNKLRVRTKIKGWLVARCLYISLVGVVQSNHEYTCASFVFPSVNVMYIVHLTFVDARRQAI